MKIIQTTGKIEKGKLSAVVPKNLSDGEVDLVIVAKNEPDQFNEMRKLAEEKGYNSREKIMDLIHQVKLEKLEEKGRG
ncbi:hypothetical protein [Dactylococcopsis salina]|uniref:Uncharacterized protein n=1 Tax=Dactylococcopsis salina (strain PCC 8305) TaxID=13035 RepID=K9YY15_DACS8|nr:hypothetical protein [Dactylococcopsis salina]AFZ51185.1 hypothetical protein Dacsa_2598 [Dactylococcopsis salina PCC 8305]